MSTIYIRDFAVANGRKDYQVVVKPHPGGTVNRHGINFKKDARAYAAELQASLGFEVVDETK